MDGSWWRVLTKRYQTLFPSPVTSKTGHCFCFGSISSFFLELFLCSSQVGYWAPTDLGSSSFSVISFYLFILFIGFSRQEWFAIPFSSRSCFVRTLHHDPSILGGPTNNAQNSPSKASTVHELRTSRCSSWI